jgi:hypothetical protein
MLVQRLISEGEGRLSLQPMGNWRLHLPLRALEIMA